jgi:hypothetical protein
MRQGKQTLNLNWILNVYRAHVQHDYDWSEIMIQLERCEMARMERSRSYKYINIYIGVKNNS